jgi:predicted HTH transcriptional regulator
MKEALTIPILKEIVDSKNMDQLIGYAENNFFDAKELFYNLYDPKDKHELCKDITAFANNNGGFLLIGCKTEKAQHELADYVKSADGMKDFPSTEVMYSTLLEYVYPNSIGTFVKFENITAVNGKKFFLISISGNSEERPYFVRRDAQNREFVAYYVRTHDRGVRYHIEHLHELVHQGIHFEKYLKNIAGTSDRILNNTEKLIGKNSRKTSTSTRYDFKKYL